MLFLKVFTLSVLCIALYKAEDLIIGTTVNNALAYTENVKLSAIPMKVRTKNVFYNSNSTTVKTIKAVTAIDIDRTEGTASITSGGVGSTYVNIRIKGERGKALNYLVQIFN